jgi:hypothetical protein
MASGELALAWRARSRTRGCGSCIDATAVAGCAKSCSRERRRAQVRLRILVDGSLDAHFNHSSRTLPNVLELNSPSDSGAHVESTSWT